MKNETRHIDRRFSTRAAARAVAIGVLLGSSLASTACDKLDDWAITEREEYDSDRMTFCADSLVADSRPA